MNQTAAAFYQNIKGKEIYFLGAGVSHRQLIVQFAKAGARVTLCDRQNRADFGAYGDEIETLGVAMQLGEGYLSRLDGADMIFRSPGIDYTKPEIQQAVRDGIEVTSEMEKFFELCPAPIIAVTGSDGKTTTTTLIAEMLKEAGFRVHLGGNIGVPLLPVVETVTAGDVAVVELSSFQLISMRRSPHIAVVTNLSPNHLDHHKDMDEYIDAKRNILRYQSTGDVAVLNAENDITKSFAQNVRGELRWFSSRKPVENGAYIDESLNLVLVQNGSETVMMNLAGIKLPGAHNRENVVTAAAAVQSLVPETAIRKVASDFPGVEHRIELVRERDGIRWYNDSIGTSPTRTIAGLRSFDQKIILIAGGYDKKSSYAPLAPEILRNVRYLLLCGDTAAVIRKEVEQHSEYKPDELVIERMENLEQAVLRAAEIAQEGDVVMMSPASASFDAYNNFEERGRHFKKLVEDLE